MEVLQTIIKFHTHAVSQMKDHGVGNQKFEGGRLRICEKCITYEFL